MAGERCIEWGGARNAGGYGVMPKAVHGSRLAHRAALAEKLRRPVQGEARHTCDNPPCINPEHLLEGSHAENMADAAARNRTARGPRKTTCVRGHDVTSAGRREGSGGCVACRKEDNVLQAQRRREARHNRGLVRRKKG